MRKPIDGKLVLEDGTAFVGHRFGATSDARGEVVFNTGMTGYQEILTDPSYTGQIVVMTYPQIGNYGISPEDVESRKLFLSALVVKEVSGIASNWRSVSTLDEYLRSNGIPGLEGLDTRMLVRHLRTRGAMRGVMASHSESTDSLTRQANVIPSMLGCDLASSVTSAQPYVWTDNVTSLKAKWRQQDFFASAPPSHAHVVVIDYGVKRNILRHLAKIGCRVTVVPAGTTAEDILALHPDGVLLSNGPGDPDPMRYAVTTIQNLLGMIPIFGICLGHQLLGIAAGGKTYKLKFGHRGSNHPILNTRSGKVDITSHNHGFAVDADSLPQSRVEITHVNLNDQTVEGLALRDVPAFSVQYHPEAAPGPHDSHYLFRRFADLMREFRGEKSSDAEA